jgi:hypothetical protein
MKKGILISLGLIVIGVLTYAIPRIQAARSAQPLHGLFDVGMKCMGGHEIFLELADDVAYDNCPGHRERKKVARIVRDESTATVMDPRDDRPWFRIEWNGSQHSLVFLKHPDSQSIFGMIPVRGEIRQVNDPWRLWLPRLLPEG